MKGAAANFAYHELWPEAIAVYMQGLNTPGALTDPEGKKPGWQKTVGDQNDRDLKFFDAVLATLKKDYKVDEKRIYATGHSNGGGFTYLLWAARGTCLPPSRPVRRPPDRRAADDLPAAAAERSGRKRSMEEPQAQAGAAHGGRERSRWCGSSGRSGRSTGCGSSTAAARASPGASTARCIPPRPARRS